MIDHAKLPGPIAQFLSVDEGSGPSSQSVAENARGDACDRPRTSLPATWSVMAVPHRRTRQLVRARPRRCNTCTLIVVLVSALSAVGLSFVPKPFLLIYNASGSVPIGLYATNGGRVPRRNRLMLVALPDPWRQFAAARGYLPLNVLALKRVVAGPGDVICARKLRIFLNGRFVASRAKVDAMHRPMPTWAGCSRLDTDQWFLLNPAAQSFDSRYFGPVSSAAMQAEVISL